MQHVSVPYHHGDLRRALIDAARPAAGARWVTLASGDFATTVSLDEVRDALVVLDQSPLLRVRIAWPVSLVVVVVVLDRDCSSLGVDEPGALAHGAPSRVWCLRLTHISSTAHWPYCSDRRRCAPSLGT